VADHRAHGANPVVEHVDV
jgi:hypothetical protein